MQRKVLVPALLVMTLLATGCQGMPIATRPGEQVIPFTTLAAIHMASRLPPTMAEPQIVIDYGSSTPGAETLPRQPQVFLVTAPEAVAPFQQWLVPEVLTALAAVDYEQYFVIAFFLGLSGGGADGYIERIALDTTGAINVYAVKRQFSAGPAISTFPSHIVQMRREDVPISLDAGTPVNLATRAVLGF